MRDFPLPSAVRPRNGNQLSKDDVLRDGAHVVGLWRAETAGGLFPAGGLSCGEMLVGIVKTC